MSYANVDVDALGDDGSDGLFAFQLGAGVGFQVSPTVTVDAKYRYFASADPEIEIDPRNWKWISTAIIFCSVSGSVSDGQQYGFPDVRLINSVVRSDQSFVYPGK